MFAEFHCFWQWLVINIQPFSSVTVLCAREAALDAQFLVIASNLGKEKANELRSEMTTFESLTFAEDLVSSRLGIYQQFC